MVVNYFLGGTLQVLIPRIVYKPQKPVMAVNSDIPAKM